MATTEVGSSSRWAAALQLLGPEDRQLIAFEGRDKLEVLTELQVLTDNAKQMSIEKRWRFNRPGRGGETVILRDLFTKIILWIDCFKASADLVVQCDPIHAALPWAGARFLLQVGTSDPVHLHHLDNFDLGGV